MISQSLEQIFNYAIIMANNLKHEYLSMEVVLKSLLKDPVVNKVLQDCGAKVDQLAEELDDFLKVKDNFSILTDEKISLLAKEQFSNQELKSYAEKVGILYQPEISLALQRVIQRAALHIQSSGKKEIRGINLLIAMFNERESYAVYLLNKAGIQRFSIIEKISHSLDKPINSDSDQLMNPGLNPDHHRSESSEGQKSKKDPLLEYATNLNELVKKGEIDPIIGRENELKRVFQILTRRRKNNPLLVGESGVGKTAIAEGLAYVVEQGDVAAPLKNTQVYRLDLASLLAGTKFRGDFEERLKGVIHSLKERKSKGENAILYIDEIHTIIGAGSTSGGSMDASNLLKPALNSGEIRCMGSTTFSEYRKFFEKDQALTRRFQKVEVGEPTEDETIKILEGLKGQFENFHGVKYSSSILKTAVKLANRYITDRKMPDKAIDVIDEVGAYLQLLPSKGAEKRTVVTNKDIETIVSLMAKVPQKTVNSNEKHKLKNLEQDLKFMIFGQDHAVEQTVNAILLARSGLSHQQKPIASFIFAGPTGVGKTELAKQLAFQLGSFFKRFDMSEYMEKHSVSKLIGAPPGYVGYDQGGLLTDAINQNPHSVLLLDEIEKAHPDIYNILLQVMDHGSLTDANGRVTDFRNVILIMTTNAGASDMENGNIGLTPAGSGKEAKRDKAIKNFFSPEFRNRLDAIIHFNQLNQQNIRMIVDKFLTELQHQLDEKKIQIEIDQATKDFIGESAFDQKLGARPIARFIDENIKKKLAKEILFGDLSSGGMIKISLKEQKIEINFSKKV